MSTDMTVAQALRLRKQCEDEIRQSIRTLSDALQDVGVLIAAVDVDLMSRRTVGGTTTPDVRVALELAP